MAPNEYLFERDCGILLNPTSLPNDYGIGDFGPRIHQWIEMLAAREQNLWQILPLNPAGYGDSPYQGLSAFAANPALLSPESLFADGLIGREVLGALRLPCDRLVDYRRVYGNKLELSVRAAQNFFQRPEDDPLRIAYRRFLETEADWIEEFALFYALKASFGGVAWTDWPKAYRDREPEALKTAAKELASDLRRAKFEQFFLRRQWEAVRATARGSGVRMIGDLPIFVAHDSADVWSRRRLFRLNADGMPSVMAGVPPDYFSSTGQFWGNPLYDWQWHIADDFDWWQKRLRKMLSWVDVVRIDHFRGFESCWEVPGTAKAATEGRWVPSPGHAIFERFESDLGRPLPVIAEDLGVITPEVTALRDRFNLPGIRIEQFAFGTDPMKSTFLPDNYERNCVAYTGTHDNDTVMGWFNSEAGEDSTRSAEEIENERSAALAYFGGDGSAIHWDFIEKLYDSACGAAVVPLQDVLGLGSEARMNTPGLASGSWRWRLEDFEELRAPLHRLGELTRKTRRGQAAAKAAAC